MAPLSEARAHLREALGHLGTDASGLFSLRDKRARDCIEAAMKLLRKIEKEQRK